MIIRKSKIAQRYETLRPFSATNPESRNQINLHSRTVGQSDSRTVGQSDTTKYISGERYKQKHNIAVTPPPSRPAPFAPPLSVCMHLMICSWIDIGYSSLSSPSWHWCTPITITSITIWRLKWEASSFRSEPLSGMAATVIKKIVFSSIYAEVTLIYQSRCLFPN